MGVGKKVQSVQPIKIIHILCVPIISFDIRPNKKNTIFLNKYSHIFITWCDSLKYQKMIIKGQTIKYAPIACYFFFPNDGI